MDRTTRHEHERRHTAALAIAGALLAATALAGGAGAQSPAPFTAATIAPPGSDPLGYSYESWAARWWTWLLGIPAETNPGLADTCDLAQRGNAVFIPQTFFGMEHAVTCNAGASQSVLVTAGGSICTLEEGDTEADALACVAESDATIFNPSVTVDGQPVEDLDAYFVVVSGFSIDLPEGNLFELPAGATEAAASGWFVMLSDLTPGGHTVVARDESTDEAGTVVAAQLTAKVEMAEPSTATVCALALDREPAWDETFSLSGEGFAPGVDLQLTFIEPDQTWTWGGPNGDMQPSGLRTRDDGSFGPYDIAFTDPTPADLGNHVIEATDGTCAASVEFALGAP
jgi:hypothetical protein